jgi:hypothetical protein
VVEQIEELRAEPDRLAFRDFGDLLQNRIKVKLPRPPRCTRTHAAEIEPVADGRRPTEDIGSEPAWSTAGTAESSLDPPELYIVE